MAIIPPEMPTARYLSTPADRGGPNAFVRYENTTIKGFKITCDTERVSFDLFNRVPPIYDVLIDRLQVRVSNKTIGTLALNETRAITIRKNFDQMIEISYEGQYPTEWVDVSRTVDRMYYSYRHQPYELSLQEALEKCTWISPQGFKYHSAFFNRHGVIIMLMREDGEYRFFVAEPSTPKVTLVLKYKIASSKKQIEVESELPIVFHLMYKFDSKTALFNYEKATPIPLESITQERQRHGNLEHTKL